MFERKKHHISTALGIAFLATIVGSLYLLKELFRDKEEGETTWFSVFKIKDKKDRKLHNLIEGRVDEWFKSSKEKDRSFIEALTSLDDEWEVIKTDMNHLKDSSNLNKSKNE